MNQLTKKLSEILSYGLNKNFTSVSYAIMKDGELLAADSLGVTGDKNNTPATTECTYNVASVSKIYCTVAVMQLVEQGKVDLDTPVCNYLPRMWMPDERFRKITLRHCLSHTSGLPGTQWKGFSVTSVKGANYYDDVYDYLSKNLLKAEPGEYAVYCNDGFTIAEMVVAEVTGEKYEEYCMNHITEPIGAHSSRLSPLHNEKNTLIRQKGWPAELLLIQGGAGYTTSMSDLCRFGNLFLTENSVISEESKAEMAKRQGRTFLENDMRGKFYGLGWDNVNFAYPNYDLGDHVLLKGGKSFEFTTQFFVIPKYNAVIAMSETDDCGLDVQESVIRLFAVAMHEQGINIYKDEFAPIPENIIKEDAGLYLMPSGILNCHMYGAHCTIMQDTTAGKSTQWAKTFNYDGEGFKDSEGRTLVFENAQGRTYALSCLHGLTAPVGEKATEWPELSEAWENRMGKKYVVTDASPYDMVICNNVTGFTVRHLEGVKGVVMLSFTARSISSVYSSFEAPVKPIDDNMATGFLRTPANPSRDLMTPMFRTVDGAEYCDCASFTYREVSTLPLYEGQGFEAPAKENRIYRFGYTLTELPEIPEDRRLMVLDEDLTCIYDSVSDESYKPVKKGYIMFI